MALWGISIVATAFVSTWLFNNMGGSVLAVTIFHGLFNVSNGLVALQPGVTGELIRSRIRTVGCPIMAEILHVLDVNSQHQNLHTGSIMVIRKSLLYKAVGA